MKNRKISKKLLVKEVLETRKEEGYHFLNFQSLFPIYYFGDLRERYELFTLKGFRFSLLLFILLLNSGIAVSQADAGLDKSVCIGSTTGVQIGGAGCAGCCYIWTPATGLSDDKVLNPMATPTVTTTYTLTVVGPDFSFKATDDVKVEVAEIDKIQYMKNGTLTDVPGGGFSDICLGSNIAFKAILKSPVTIWPDNQPVWGGVATGTGETNTATFSASGAQTVTATCGTSMKSVAVEVKPANAAVAITWDAADYASANVNASSTTVEKAFVVNYEACGDVAANEWKLLVQDITGDVTITVNYGGSRNAITNPPVDSTEAKEAVVNMKGYYARGSRGAWHTEAASSAHESHHYDEWQCSSNNYWPDTETCLEDLKVAYSSHATEAAAITAMQATASGLVTTYKAKARQYWFTLPDNASSRPYAAGQLTLNTAIISVQTLATTNGWVVEAGVDSPSAANPCFMAFLGYTCP